MYTGYVYNNISVVNLAGVGTNNCTVAGLRATIPIMQSHYPDRAFKVFIINANIILRASWYAV